MKTYYFSVTAELNRLIDKAHADGYTPTSVNLTREDFERLRDEQGNGTHLFSTSPMVCGLPISTERVKYSNIYAKSREGAKQ